MFIDPPYIGKRIGRQMFNHLKAFCLDKGIPELNILADPNAAGFYLKMGFQRIGRHPSRPEGRMLPVLALHKQTA